MRPKGILIDCGGTLLDELSYEPRRGHEWLLSCAVRNPSQVTIDQLVQREQVINNEVVARRDEYHLETPWPMIARLIYDFWGIQFDRDVAGLELGFWKASMETSAFPGSIEALDELHRNNIPIGVVSNSIFRSATLRYELAKAGLAENLQFVMTSSEYGVRKPSPLLFDIALSKIDRKPEDIWFVGDRFDVDINGAVLAGMTPVWFRPPLDSSKSCMCVADWNEFLVLFRNA